MKILVTGSNGQLGSELKELSEKHRAEFVFTDKHTLDITNVAAIESFFANQRVDIVINGAAYTAVDQAESDTEAAFLTNATAVGYLAAACKKHGAKLIHISTDFVFDGMKQKPYEEQDATRPLNTYGKSKLQGEQLCRQYNPDAIIIRTSWLYSSYGHNFVKTILRLSAEKKVLRVVDDQRGSPTYARDLAKAILLIIGHEKGMSTSGIFHYSNLGECSWFDFASEIIALTDRNCSIVPIPSSEYPTPARRPHYSVLSKNKIVGTFGLTIPFWKDSLKECLKLLI